MFTSHKRRKIRLGGVSRNFGIFDGTLGLGGFFSRPNMKGFF
jgi:hypothetical protein